MKWPMLLAFLIIFSALKKKLGKHHDGPCRFLIHLFPKSVVKYLYYLIILFNKQLNCLEIIIYNGFKRKINGLL